MTPERMQQVDRVFQAALERAPEQRTAFIKEACGSDDSLRREVEALLAADGEAGSLIEAPAYAMAAPLIVGDEAPSFVGESIGHYHIISLLGKGGMGEVYRARDARLSRDVAVKVLPQTVSQDAERLRRFEREARAASALNHPNIITIHEIGAVQTEAAETRYIVTEYVAGETLRQRMTAEKISLSEALEVATQGASALAAAHEAGIIHRDIKPENVMVRPDGLVKVLDFGLAKLTVRPLAEVDSQTPTLPKQSTAPGVVMGTVSYMSPEQARGQEVDGRADIFSLGVVLYEMIAGRAPFEGVNALDIVGAILNHEPAPLGQHAPETPAELQRIVTKALRKDREQRYQHSKDLLLDLKALKEELEFAAKLKGAQPFIVPPANGSAPQRENPPAGGTTNAQPAEAATDEVALARTTSSAAYLISEIKRHKTGVLVGLAVLLACAGGLAYGLYRWAAPKPPIARFQNLQATRMTTSGQVQDVALSPDGKYIAYVNGGRGVPLSLWLRQVATGQERELVQIEAGNRYSGLAFSPDGNYVYYATGPSLFATALYRVPILGSTPRKLSDGPVNSAVTFSPTGERFAFARGNGNSVISELVIANADGSNEQVLATLKLPERFIFPAWSPDGKIIACSLLTSPKTSVLVAVAVDSGQQTTIGVETLEGIYRATWLPDGSGMVTSANKVGEAIQLWFISYPTGAARQLTNDLDGYYGSYLSADGRTLVALRLDSKANIWLAPGDKPDQARETTSVTRRTNNDWIGVGLAWVPDNRLLYTTDTQNTTTLWMMDPSGGRQRQLSLPEGMPSINSPKLTPDGRYLLFASRYKGVAGIWRTDANGDNLRQLVTLQNAPLLLDCSPDSQWIVYVNTVSGKGERLWKMGIDGSNPVQLTDFLSTWPSISPDGKQIAFSYGDKGEEPRAMHFGLIPFEGGPVTKIIEMPRTANFPNYQFKWMPHGRALAFLDRREGVNNIWMLPISGGEPRPLTQFKADGVYAFAWSRDGKWLALSRGSQTSDVVLLSESR